VSCIFPGRACQKRLLSARTFPERVRMPRLSSYQVHFT
jgi:hypothetical protein